MPRIAMTVFKGICLLTSMLLLPLTAYGQQACANAGTTTISLAIGGTGNSMLFGEGRVDVPLSCAGTKRVEVFLLGVTGGYRQGTFDPGLGSCIGTASGQGLANSFAKAEMLAGGQFYGWWTGEAHYFYIASGTWYPVGPFKRGSIYGEGPPPVDCSDPAYQDHAECGSPIVVPLNPRGTVQLTSVANGVRFDLDADGEAEQIAWTDPRAAVAFLAMDRNGNGRIDDGSELFGDYTFRGIEPNGFAALAALTHQDMPSAAWDGIVDTEPLFARLLLWFDKNHNGSSEPEELLSAGTVLSGIGLGYQPNRLRDAHDNLFAYRGFAWYLDGYQRAIFDVYLRRETSKQP